MQAFFDLASRPEYVEPLREELQNIMSEEGERDLGPRALAKLPLMDSFLKESQRHVAQNIRKPPLRRLSKSAALLTHFCVISIRLPQSHVSPHHQRRHHHPRRLLRLRPIHGPRGRP